MGRAQWTEEFSEYMHARLRAKKRIGLSQAEYDRELGRSVSVEIIDKALWKAIASHQDEVLNQMVSEKIINLVERVQLTAYFTGGGCRPTPDVLDKFSICVTWFG